MNNLIKDVLGNELVIGDVIVYNPPYYKGVERGTITGFSAKFPKIDGHCVKTGVAKVYTKSSCEGCKHNTPENTECIYCSRRCGDWYEQA